jgi:hypothetical protein
VKISDESNDQRLGDRQKRTDRDNIIALWSSPQAETPPQGCGKGRARDPHTGPNRAGVRAGRPALPAPPIPAPARAEPNPSRSAAAASVGAEGERALQRSADKPFLMRQTFFVSADQMVQTVRL